MNTSAWLSRGVCLYPSLDPTCRLALVLSPPTIGTPHPRAAKTTHAEHNFSPQVGSHASQLCSCGAPGLSRRHGASALSLAE
jgi:hypothetical protein